MKFLLWCCSFIVLHNLSAQDHNISIEYKVQFNKNFDRGISMMSYTATLNVDATTSIFFMIPDNRDDVAGNELSLSAATDTFLFTSKDITNQKLVFASPSLTGKTYYYNDTLHPMQWELFEDEKLIDSLLCYKATCVFRGRQYIAWYCPAIAMPHGPWKLGGLPGLIIEALDVNDNLHFTLSKLTYEKRLTDQVRTFSDDLPDFEGYKNYWTALIKKMDGALTATETNSSCVGCQTKSTSKVYMWEKWTE